MITGYELIEKMYSENYDEYEDTRLYSTGDDELDDLLERAFCDGYSYAQKEFGKVEDEDYYESLEKERKENNQLATITLPSVLGLGGAAIGVGVGQVGKAKDEKEAVKKIVKGALAGGAAGTAGGILWGRKIKKKNNEKFDKKRDRYKTSSEKDRKYLRHRREIEEKERNDNRRTAAMVGAIGSYH